MKSVFCHIYFHLNFSKRNLEESTRLLKIHLLGSGVRLLKFSCFIPVCTAQQVHTGCSSYEEEIARVLL